MHDLVKTFVFNDLEWWSADHNNDARRIQSAAVCPRGKALEVGQITHRPRKTFNFNGLCWWSADH